jgi:anti-sigma factor RsiW
MNIYAKHIPLEQLADLADKRVTAAERSELSAHLSSCGDCSSELTRLTNAITNMRADDSIDAPRDVLFHAINLFPRAVTTSVVRRILAVLTFDSFTSAPAFGTRSGLSDSRQLIFSAGDHDIDLHISTKDNTWTIAGQILGSVDCGKGNLLLENDDYSVSSELSGSCEFKIADVPPGDYHLRLSLADLELEVPRLELRK